MSGRPRGDVHRTDGVCEAFISLCGSGAGLSRMREGPTDSSPWPAELLPLAEQHGLMGLLWASRGQCWPAAANPNGLPSVAKRSYLLQTASNLGVLAQLEEIANAFTTHGIRLVALKGAAALLWLYDDIGCRSMSDIDLLVEECSVPDTKRIMRGLGYREQGWYNSPEDELFCIRNSHLVPYVKASRRPVEVHATILAGRGRYETAMREVWAECVPLACGTARLWSLCPSHFLLHTAIHFMKHFSTGCFISLKQMVDMILLVSNHRGLIDWPTLWQTAERWGVTNDVTTVVATLNHHWGLDIPIPRSRATAISAHTLVYGPEQPMLHAAAGRYRGYVRRLVGTTKLPGMKARLRYYFRLVFPEPAALRYRYNLSEGAALAPYYLLRPLTLGGRFISGLAAAIWLQFSRSQRRHSGRSEDAAFQRQAQERV